MQRAKFIIPENIVYMCGHSLGPISVSAKDKIELTINDWQNYAVSAWNKANWIDLPYSIAAKIAPIIGADESEVIVSDSTSVNLFKVLMSALNLQQDRKIILTTDDNFPADLYIAEGINNFNKNVTLKIVTRDKLIENLDNSIAILMLTHVNYRDASIYNMAEICEQAHKLGIIVVWDLSHSIGIVPLNLNACNTDFAIGCTYKYLNGGPGSPSFVYINRRYHRSAISPIWGWMGHENPFSFKENYSSKGSASFIGGTPYILSIKGLEGALEVFENINMQDLYSKSLEHSSYLLNSLAEIGLQVISPKTGERGGHVAFLHESAYPLSRAIIDNGVICDFRAPDLIRLCVNPLYLDLQNIKFCIEQITKVLTEKTYLSPKYHQKSKVT